MAETELLLLRHGETEWNREGRIQGYHADSALTGAGRAQTEALARRIAGERIAGLYSSDAGRARLSVEPIERETGLRAMLDPGLRERSYGVFEGLTYEQVRREFPEVRARLLARDPDFAVEGGETAAQFRERIAVSLAAIARHRAGERIAVMTHGGVVAVLYLLADGTPAAEGRGLIPDNASLSRFGYARGAWRLLQWSDTAHLPADAGPPRSGP